ncbi:hypothetical protein [Roseibium sediminicola]|uniref:Uncharacterized protein n=1 Tax=Roseibium sediminicola TaxID=2933272 RepID=A0ABT0H1I3_9HYPH|nr:hypothetical protein [Roseibium sp. CAU 1639]MCK7615162.1 hypothetical protein [Roseibium sp. CAU 1639]
MSRRSGRRLVLTGETLAKLGTGRAGAVDVMTRAKIGSPEYKRASYVLNAVDDLAEVLTGDHKHFHSRPATTEPRE